MDEYGAMSPDNLSKQKSSIDSDIKQQLVLNMKFKLDQVEEPQPQIIVTALDL
jgi:hypothetical protein